MHMKEIINTVNVCLISISLFALGGCDTESVDENNVVITPSTATIDKGEAITFTASGGFEYEWSLGDVEGGDVNQWAKLSTRKGASTVYTSLRDSSSNAVPTVITLIVNSYIPGSGASSNSTEDVTYAGSHQAEAYITHTLAETAALVISPGSRTIGSNQIEEFTASGGTGTYAWTISNTTYGTLSSASGNKVMFISNAAAGSGSVVLTVTSGNASDIAIINYVP